MRAVLRLLGNRYGLAGLLVLGIGAVLLVARLVGGGSAAPPLTTGAGSPGPAGGATATASLSTQDNDGPAEDIPESPGQPSTSPGAAGPLAVANQFTAAWLRHTGVSAQDWYAGLRRYLTAHLAGELSGVDPAGVPANRVTGTATLIPHDAGFVEVTVPLDTGMLTLRLLATGGRWLVDGVDWTAG
ncbi:MAG: hypothetical protein J2P15_23130 [Micromonosporaceae bacterium]|nr:hypothetical protein [Micromonosporaceae bacterium]